jgi:hypothetical protein
MDITHKTFRKIGFDIARGFCEFIAILFIISFVLTKAYNYFRPIDDCDRAWNDRCGFSILTDNKTGIQYLVTRQGNIIRRGE